jgi:mannosyltransferase OCH1-like enzyme
MKLLIDKTDYIETINIALNLKEDYEKSVIFHSYWNGQLNKKHLYSILSCYYFNVYKNKQVSDFKIILWLENNKPNKYNVQIEKYAEIKNFSLSNEILDTKFITSEFYYKKELSFYSDVVRYLLLYNYGGIWFDLDCFFLRSFSPIFNNFENEICVYQWENQNYPNGAIYISLIPKSEKMRHNIQFIIKHNRGWGFQEASLTYDLPLDMLVLPCSWFNADWIKNPFNIGTEKFFEETNINYDFDNFFKGSFCYHWHNKWNHKIEDNSIIKQLVKIIKRNLSIMVV